MPTITIISGVNGSGKSTLYKILGDIGVKINADDIGKELEGIKDRKA